MAVSIEDRLTRAWFPLRYHPVQNAFYRSKARFRYVAAGRGSGKTEIARRYIVRMLPVRKPWYDPLYFYALPTYPQAKRIAWRKLCDLIPDHWIEEKNKSELYIKTVFGSALYVLGMDRPIRAEGVQWDGGVLDESCDQKPGTFGLSLLPAMSERNAWCARIGVPKRTGVGAAEFKAAFEKAKRGDDSEGEAFEWPSEDILTRRQIEVARENLTEEDYNEQYRAQWQSVSGTIFYAFSEEHNVLDSHDVEVSYRPSERIIVGSDFNVDPMCWVLCHERNGKVFVFAEIVRRNTNTQATLDYLHSMYGSHQGGWAWYGDATGQQRKTAAAVTDYIQIKADRRFQCASIHYPKANPPRADRFASANGMMRNANGEHRLFVSSKCKWLINDLLNRAYKPGTREPDDQGDVGHITDGLTYYLWRRFPLTIPEPEEKDEVIYG